MLPNITKWGWPSTFLAIKYTLITHCTNKHWNRFSPPNTLDLLLQTSFKRGQHVTEISSKATKKLGFLRRNLALAPRHTKKAAYQTLVRPQLEYAAPIWHHNNDTETEKVEKVQKTAARWVCRRWHNRKVQLGNDLEKAQSERNSTPKAELGKN